MKDEQQQKEELKFSEMIRKIFNKYKMTLEDRQDLKFFISKLSDIEKAENEKFDDLVKTYYPLNKSKTRYLIFFKDKTSYCYRYNKKDNMLIKEGIK